MPPAVWCRVFALIPSQASGQNHASALCRPVRNLLVTRAVSTRAKHIRALILDLDGVVTDTAMQHYRAWKRLFDAYLGEHATGEAARPFTRDDYLSYVDGKSRIDGADSFLRSRGIVLDRG